MDADESAPTELDRLAEEFVERTRRGEAPSISEYCRTHPVFAKEIEQMFPLLRDLEQVPRPATTEVQDRLGDFQIVREIGRGGMGVVYEAIQEPLGRRVALKVLPHQLTRDPTFLERFRREAQAAAALQHAHIVPVIAWGEHEGTYYYTMQFVDGRGLDELDELPGEGTRADRAARLMLQASEGIAAAHAQGVLHRDVKPSNILCDEQAQVWITDFGLCKLTESGNLTGSGDLLGTLRYMAPERFEGVSDVQGDVYGLGLTLYELVTGRPAFPGEDRAQLAARIARATPTRPRRIDPTVPRDLERIVLKAIARERSQRYATAEALAGDLRAYLARKPISARPPTVRYLTWSFMRRHKALTGLAAIAVLGLVASSLYYVTSLKEKERVARFRQYVANIAAAETALRDRDVPVAEQLLDEAPEEFRNWEWHHLQSRLDRSTRIATRWPWSVQLVTYSPTGRHVASAAGGQVRIQDEASHELLASIEHRSHVHCFAWHPEKRQYAVGTEVGLEIWDWETQQRLQEIPGRPIYAAAYDPIGPELAFGGADGVVTLLDTRSGRPRHDHQAQAPVRSLAWNPTKGALAVGTQDARVRMFTGHMVHPLWTRRVGRARIRSLAFAGAYLAIPSSDGHVELRSKDTGELVEILGHDHPAGGARVATSADGASLVSTDGPFVHCWDMNTFERLITYGNDSRTTCLARHPTADRMITGSQRGTVREWELSSGNDPDVWHLEHQQLMALDYCPTRHIHAAGGAVIRVFDSESQLEIRNWIGHKTGVHTIRFGPKGRHAATADYAGEVLIWDVETDQLLHRLQASDGTGRQAARIAFSADGRELFTAGRDGTLRAYSVESGTLRKTSKLSQGWLTSIAASPTGDLIAVSDIAGVIHLADPDDLSSREYVAGHEGMCTELAFDRSGQRLASASWDRTVRIWDMETRRCIRVLRAHESDSPGVADALLSVSFLPGGSRIAASSADGSAKIWDLASGRLVLTLRGAAGWMYGVRFTRDGQALLSVEAGGRLRVWSTRPFSERTAVRKAWRDALREIEDDMGRLGADLDWSERLERVRANTGWKPLAKQAAVARLYRERATTERLIDRAWSVSTDPRASKEALQIAAGIASDMYEATLRAGVFDSRVGTLHALASCRVGRFREAIRALEPKPHRYGDTRKMATDLGILAWAHREAGDADQARRYRLQTELLTRKGRLPGPDAAISYLRAILEIE